MHANLLGPPMLGGWPPILSPRRTAMHSNQLFALTVLWPIRLTLEELRYWYVGLQGALSAPGWRYELSISLQIFN